MNMFANLFQNHFGMSELMSGQTFEKKTLDLHLWALGHVCNILSPLDYKYMPADFIIFMYDLFRRQKVREI